jgi:hypothetical protein
MAALTSLNATAGCFNYARVPSAEARPGSEVRVDLVERGAADLARLVGPRAAALDGRLLSRNDTALTLSVSSITRTTGVDETWPGEAVIVPSSAIATLQTRRLARGRTALLMAGIVALGVAVGAAFSTAEDVNSGGGRPPGGNPR